MNQLQFIVVGAGHLGSIHARLVQSLDEVHLVGVVDPSQAARAKAEQELKTRTWSDLDQVNERIDAAIVATPTRYHHEVACKLLDQGSHLLIEKPVTMAVGEANDLIATARQRDRVLQVGHVERFNPAWNAVAPHVGTPRYVEAVRAGGYTFRSTDVSIVHDLMIHDLDLILSLAKSPVVKIEAMGITVFGPHEDIVHARIVFADGCVANLNASRVSYEPKRSMQIFGSEAFAAIDFAQSQAKIVRPGDLLRSPSFDLSTCTAEQQKYVQKTLFEDLLRLETVTVERGNAILQEQREFVASILYGEPVRVPGEQGRDALAVTERILESVRSHRWNGMAEGPIGPNIFRSSEPARKNFAA